MIPIDMKDCTLFIIDGSGLNFVVIRVGEGNFTYTVKRAIEPRKSRGNLYQLREGEEEVTDITFQFVWEAVTSSGDEPPTLEECIYGEAEGWTSASIDLNGPRTVHLQIVRSKTCRRPNATTFTEGETYNFPEFSVLSFAHSLKDATIDCSGFSNRVRPTVSRP